MSEADARPDGAPNYDNPEDKRRLDEARRKMEQAAEVEETVDAATAHVARADLAAEDQPGMDLPDLTDTFEVEFRGHTFEFQELGGSVVDAARKINDDPDLDDQEAGADGADFVYSLLGEKCTHPDSDEAYWRQYDVHREDDDGIFDLFDRLADEALDDDTLDAEQRERVEEFRGE